MIKHSILKSNVLYYLDLRQSSANYLSEELNLSSFVHYHILYASMSFSIYEVPMETCDNKQDKS